MRLVVQRVTEASARVDGVVVGSIGPGLCVLVGVGQADDADAVRWVAGKTARLRIFPDEQGQMNRSVADKEQSVLAISQFTLYGDCRKGNRPSFDQAARPERALELFNLYVRTLRESGLRVETGCFGAKMDVVIHNQGPVTLVLESPGPPEATPRNESGGSASDSEPEVPAERA